MEKEKKGFKSHCLVIPYPVTGHVNPMLQFSRRLEHKGVKVTFAVTKFIFSTMHNLSASIAIELISDGKEYRQVDMETYVKRFIELGPKTLSQLIDKLRFSGLPVTYVVYDSFMPWAIDVCKTFELPAAVFFTQSCAMSSIFYHMYKGLLKLPFTEDMVLIPGLPPMASKNLSCIYKQLESYPRIFGLLRDQFLDIEEADFVLFNNFYKLEPEVVEWLAKRWKVMTVGPTVPSIYLDKRLEDDKEYGLNMFNPNTDTCIKWLDDKPNESVAYVSFGSLAELSMEQMEEVAWGLKASNKYFLWVVRASEKPKLPKQFFEEKHEKGFVVSWCPQLQVLSHQAVGCFLSHCGYNSTIEALSLGVPVVAIPHWVDQILNSMYIMDVWGIGIKGKTNEKGMVTRQEVEHCLREVMEGEKGKEMRKNAIKWKELAREAVDVGGNSDKNIDVLVARMAHS